MKPLTRSRNASSSREKVRSICRSDNLSARHHTAKWEEDSATIFLPHRGGGGPKGRRGLNARFPPPPPPAAPPPPRWGRKKRARRPATSVPEYFVLLSRSRLAEARCADRAAGPSIPWDRS